MDSSDGETTFIDPNPKIRVGQIKWKKIRDQKILNALFRLQHACECTDTNCTNVDCDEMKSLVVHCKLCTQKPKKNCRPCKQLLALCIYHAKRSKDCISEKCAVPYCAKIKHSVMLKRKFLRKTLKDLYKEESAEVGDETGFIENFWDMPSTSAAGQVGLQPPETIVLDDDEAVTPIPDPQQPSESIEIDDDEPTTSAIPSTIVQNVEQDSPQSPDPENSEPNRFENITEPDSTNTSPSYQSAEQHLSLLFVDTEPIPNENLQEPDSTNLQGPQELPVLELNNENLPQPDVPETDVSDHQPLMSRLNQLMASWKNPPEITGRTQGLWWNEDDPYFRLSSTQQVTTQTQPSNSNGFVPSAGDAIHQLKNLLHAHKCLTGETRGAVGGWPCFESNCGFWKIILKHIHECTVEECSIVYCNSSKSLLKHWQTCIYGDCVLCSSIRRCSTIMQGLTLQGSSFNRRTTPGNSYRLARKRVLLEMSGTPRNSQHRGNNERLLPHLVLPRALWQSREGTSSSTFTA